MNTTELKKKSNDSAVETYLETHNVYESSDLCIDIAAVIKYARENCISLSAVPPEIIEQYSKAPSQLVG